jgi:hypothetical protein
MSAPLAVQKEVSLSPKEIVLSYWEAMRSNDFKKASEWLSEEFECVWPQTSEVIIGRANFSELNAQYPSNGIWTFTLNSIVTENNQVVTDMTISDGVRKDRAITFHTVENGRISKQTEFWPEPYEAPKWRSQWVKKL